MKPWNAGKAVAEKAMKTGFFVKFQARQAIAVLAQTLMRGTKMNTYALPG
jgi:hypothetical protein